MTFRELPIYLIAVRDNMNADTTYLNIAKKILVEGEWKNNRTGIRTKVIPFQHFQHNMADGFPLLTTKKMGLKNIAAELEFFIKGLTEKKWLKDRNCHIWDEWANPKVVGDLLTGEVKKDIQRRINDLGPIYGYQWRSFGEQYGEVEVTEREILDTGSILTEHPNGLPKGADQLISIVDKLKNNPDDRRMVCSAWNPNQTDHMALPPCHLLWNVVVINGTLHLHWHQRSCDYFLGVPYNIASYALLMKLLCKESGLKEGMLSGLLADCHIYENHIEQIEEQIGREPYEAPQVEILDRDGKFSIFDWQYTDFKLNNYNSHPAIKGEVAI